MAESLKLACSVDFDEDWIQATGQSSCHWNCARYFDFTCKIFNGDIYSNKECTTVLTPGASINKVEFYYCFGPYKEVSNTLSYYTMIPSTDISVVTTTSVDHELSTFRKVSTYNYQLYFSSFTDTQLATLYASGCVTVYVKATDSAGAVYNAHYTLPYSLEASPKITGEVFVKKLSSRKFLCSWPKAEEAFENSPVAGYCFELKHRPAGTSSYKNVGNLALTTDTNGDYKVIKTVPESTEIKIPKALDGEDPIESYIGEGASREVYLPGPDTTSVYFDPQEFGIESKDLFKVTIYPYIVYSSYTKYDSQGKVESIEPSALLSGNSISSPGEDGTTGLVRIKTSNGWKEGQVWVKTSSGWKEASIIYTKTASGWKETI